MRPLSLDVDLSKRIQSIRFLLISLIVLRHNILTEVRFPGRIEIVVIPEYMTIVQTVCNIIISSAVPLFSIISSYLLYSKEIKFISVLKKKSKTILLPYILWTVLTLLFFFIAQNISLTKTYFASNLIKDFTVIDWIDAFVGKFTPLRDYQYPLLYQFHFLRDLYILSLLSIVIKKIVDRFPLGTILLFFIIWIGNINIYLVAPRMLLFFSLGYYAVKYSLDCRTIDQIKTYNIFVLYAIIIIMNLFFGEKIPIIFNICVLTGVTLFIKTTKYFINNDKIFNLLSRLAKYSFFVFATHSVVLAIVNKISFKIFSIHGGWILVQYFGGTFLTISILALVGALIRKTFPKTYAILTGGRLYDQNLLIKP